MKNPPPPNDGVLNFLSSILKKSEEGQKVSPQEVEALAAGVRILSHEMKSITQTIELMLTAIQNQNNAISELYTVQEFVLKKIKDETETKLDTVLEVKPKNKPEKPN